MLTDGWVKLQLTSGSLRKNFRAPAGHGHEVDRVTVACSLVSDSMALLRGTQRRASVHADAPRFAGQKIIQKNFEFVAVSKFLCMCSGTFCSTSMGHRCRSPVCGNMARVRNPMRMSFYRPRRVRGDQGCIGCVIIHILGV